MQPVQHLLRRVLFSLPLVLLATGSQTTLAQFQTTDPYDPYNRYYKPFTYPVQTNISDSLPNQSRMGNIGSGMRGPGFLDSIDGAGEDLFGRGMGRLEGIGNVPGGQYEANAGDTFYADQQKREEKYFEAMGEKDRRKRAVLMREYQEMTRKAARGASNRAAAKAKKAKPKSPGTGETAPKEAETSLLRDDPDSPRSSLRQPSDLLVPRSGALRGGLLRNRDNDGDSQKPKSPSEVLDRSLKSEKKPKPGSLDVPGDDTTGDDIP